MICAIDGVNFCGSFACASSSLIIYRPELRKFHKEKHPGLNKSPEDLCPFPRPVHRYLMILGQTFKKATSRYHLEI